MVALMNGQALVVGGVDNSHRAGVSLDSTETWDPVASQWRNAGNLTTSRAGATATLLVDGQVLVVGGWHGRQSPWGSDVSTTQSAELWSPATRTWRRTGDLAVGRYEHTATHLGDGRVLVAGGTHDKEPYATASAEVWDPTSRQWTRASDMTVERRKHMAVSLDDGRVLVVGGTRGDWSLTSTEIWEPSTGTWAEAAAAPAETHGDLLALSGGRALFFGQSRNQGCFVAVFDGTSWIPRLGHTRWKNCIATAYRLSDRDIVAVAQDGCVYHFDPDEGP